MKKAMFVGTLFLFLVIATQSNAVMKITPSGITSPNDSGELHLNGGPFHIFGGPLGAVISAVNSYSGSSSSYGGYFKAAGTSGWAVYGEASNSGDNVENYGGYFKAAGQYGRGVYGHASDTEGINYGGYFTASGNNGMGVYGKASCSGEWANYGGYFEAAGNNGMGVYGKASYSGQWGTNYGGYFTAAGTGGIGVKAVGTDHGGFFQATNIGAFARADNFGGYFRANDTDHLGIGVYGVADGTDGYGVHGVADGANGYGVFGIGGKWDFYANGPGGNYGPFTGAHEVKFTDDMPGEIIPGMVVSVTGKTEARKDKGGVISLSSTLPTVTLSTQANDKAVFGVIVSDGPLPKDHWHEAEEGENFGVVNALGEGRVWVTDINGKVRAGDYITTSSVPGYGQMQNDDFLHSYTLGKAIETIDWEQVTETVQHNGKAYKAYLIAVVYTSG